MGLEPIRSRTRPSNVPVCQFQHYRAGFIILRGTAIVNAFSHGNDKGFFAADSEDYTKLAFEKNAGGC